jgi:hypothetical protein
MKPFIFESQNFPTLLFLRNNKEQDNRSTKLGSYQFLGGYEKKRPKLQTSEKIMPKKLAGTKILHEEKLYDLYRTLNAFSTIIYFVRLMQAENDGKLSLWSRLTEFYETRMFSAAFTTARLLY